VLGAMVLPSFLYQGAENVSAGPGFTQSAMDKVFPGFGSYFCSYCIVFLRIHNDVSLLLLLIETNIFI
jgi:AGCS family alanine or glycine:cation symporter